jgi:hypothetical protein
MSVEIREAVLLKGRMRAFVLVCFLGAASAAAGQTAKLSEHDALAILDARRVEAGCWTIAYGFIGNGNSDPEITERLHALERHGVLTTRPAKESGRLDYTITDPSVFRTVAGRHCVLMQPPDGPNKIVKIDNVTGGKIPWQGAIIYAHVTETGKHYTPFFHRFARAEGIPTHIDTFVVRVLVRHNSTTHKWDFVTADLGRADGWQFLTESVVTALDED